MNKHFRDIILKSTGASFLNEQDEIQNLWGGYGSIIRVNLSGAKMKSVIVKHVNPPSVGNESGISHKRKLKSYLVETSWYKDYVQKYPEDCRLPECFAYEKHGNEIFIVLEDLDDSGFYKRKNYIDWNEFETCLSWLAAFHAFGIDKEINGLWKTGTYWHLATRPDELKSLKDFELKKAAAKIDQKLNSCKYKTILHGDAKLANFCFNQKGDRVAVVDFQYTGGGCGMKDLAYFTGSCFNDEESEIHESDILDYYFSELKKYIIKFQDNISADAVEDEWREMYLTAWADFHRFYKGWVSGRWKADCYSERVSKTVIEKL